jgi:hypothetical protein
MPSQSNSGLTSAPRVPQTVQVKRSSSSDSRVSSGHWSALTLIVTDNATATFRDF